MTCEELNMKRLDENTVEINGSTYKKEDKKVQMLSWRPSEGWLDAIESYEKIMEGGAVKAHAQYTLEQTFGKGYTYYHKDEWMYRVEE